MFSKIIYINLDRRPDRNENVISQLNKINYNGNLERFNAIDARKLDINLMPSNLFTKKAIETANNPNMKVYTFMTKGAIGCTLSHKLVFEKILYGEHDYVLILEDDITFVDNFNDKLNNLLKNMPSYDMLFLGYHNKNDLKKYEHYDTPYEIWGLFGYIINKKAAKRLLEVFPITLQIDSELPRAFPDLKVYAVKKEEKLILSDLSQEAYTYGTDIQTREHFETVPEINNFASKHIIIILIIVCIFLLINKCRKNNLW